MQKTILSVSQLNRQAKQLLETHLPLIWVSGELSNLAQPGSGHWYFSLKDDRAQVRCAMFRQANQRLRWRPRGGMQVLVRGRVSLYEGRGDYQLIVEHMEEAGAGALQQAYEALKARLLQEGLFDEAAKQPLPAFPRHIGVITSPTGAAVHDILSVLQRRYRIARVTVIPVAVQGETAAPEMIRALQKAEAFGDFDLLMIGRGGGSLEDLWAFNDEALARALYACPIPIISAVGHEVDFTICDFVADVRAPTPSVCAEIATPDLEEWQQTLDVWQEKISRYLLSAIQQKRQQLLFLRRRLRHPRDSLESRRLRLRALETALIRAMAGTTNDWWAGLVELRHRLHQRHPRYQLERLGSHREQLNRRLSRAMADQLKGKQQSLAATCQLLEAVSPLAVLGRGYSIASREDGSIVRDVSGLKEGDVLRTTLVRGEIFSRVLGLIS